MNKHWHSSNPQVYWTCEALLEGRSISHKTEIREVKGWRLGAIIHNLRKKYDWPIITKYMGSENVAYYSLSAGHDRTKLKFPLSTKSLQECEIC